MNKKHIIALDLDGTLLDENKLIMPQTKDILQRLSNEGNIVILASGRPIRAMKRYYDELDLKTPIICYNGSYVFSPFDKNFPETRFSFPRDVIKAIYNEIGPEKIDIVMCETNKDIWISHPDESLKPYFWHDNMNLIYGDIRQTMDEDPMTFLMKSFTDKNTYDDIRNAVSKFPHIKARFWNGYLEFFSEIYYDNVSKANALKSIADYYHISYEDIIAFGDAENDIEMLQEAGHGFAMKNCDPLLLNKGIDVTEYDNQHEGIFHELNRLIYQK